MAKHASKWIYFIYYIIVLSQQCFCWTRIRHDRNLNGRHQRHHHHRKYYEDGHQCSKYYCRLIAVNRITVRQQFQEFYSQRNVALINFHLNLSATRHYNQSILREEPYMNQYPLADQFYWIRKGGIGERILSLSNDVDVLSFNTLKAHGPINILAVTHPPTCFHLLSDDCRIHMIRDLAIRNLTITTKSNLNHDNGNNNNNNNNNIINNFKICHRWLPTISGRINLLWNCCDSNSWLNEEYTSACKTLTKSTTIIFKCLFILIQLLSVTVTIFSPLFLLKLKMSLMFDNVTKFFKASLKHGITGQRNYVIRISSRQLVNLSDKKPFSLPRILLRLLLHCYGEGRCCIRLWADWNRQPNVCKVKGGIWNKFYIFVWRLVAIVLIYPLVFYIIYFIYSSKLSFFNEIIRQTTTTTTMSAYNNNNNNRDYLLDLHVNYAIIPLLSNYRTSGAVWLTFSELAFIFTLFLLAWPKYVLERSLIVDSRRTKEKNNIKAKRFVDRLLYEKMSKGYTDILYRLAYGVGRGGGGGGGGGASDGYRNDNNDDDNNRHRRRHFLSIKFIPWGFLRVLNSIRMLLMQLPIINICFSIASNQTTYFLGSPKKSSNKRNPQLHPHSSSSSSSSSCTLILKGLAAGFLWFAHIILLAGYCTAVWLICQLFLTILVYLSIGCFLNSSSVLPLLTCLIVLIFYLNDFLTSINQDHQLILKIIDENSPRISAAEDSGDEDNNDEDDFQIRKTISGGNNGGSGKKDGGGGVLSTHNLGAVKFIDGERGEYVSKELYYNVCKELKYGWKSSLKAFLFKMSLTTLFVASVFVSCSTVGSIFDKGIYFTFFALFLSVCPKFCMCWKSRNKRKEQVDQWSKIMPLILDKYIHVDRSRRRRTRRRRRLRSGGGGDDVDDNEADDDIFMLDEELSTYDVRPVGLLEIDIPKVIENRSLRLWKYPWIVSADQQTQSNEAFLLALANKFAAATFLSKFFSRPHRLPIDLDDEQVLRQWCLLIENCILEAANKVLSTSSANLFIDNFLSIDSTRKLFSSEMQHLVTELNVGNTVDSLVDSLNRQLYDPITRAFLITIGNTTFALSKINNILFAFNSNCHGDQVTDLFGAVLLTTDFNTQNLQLAVKYLIDPYSPDAVPVYSIVPVEAFLLSSPPVTPLSARSASTIGPGRETERVESSSLLTVHTQQQQQQQQAGQSVPRLEVGQQLPSVSYESE